MEYIPSPQSQAQHFILCCQCGTQIEPNLANMCVACLRSQVDITEGIPKQAILYFCKKCERYLHPPNTWISAQLESRELLSVCLKKLKGLSKVRLIDAGFVWTEPHSMRIKVKLTIQKEVMNGAILQQVFVVEYVVNSQMCDDCHRVEAKDFWRAVVQVRQKTDHKKTFYYLEQLILKHRAHVKTLNIKPEHDGLDFYYSKKDDAKKMVEFLQSVVPSRLQTAKELVSHDIHNNTFNYKHTFSVEIVPICKDSVVCLPPKVAQNLGSINPICVCCKVAQMIHFIDPNTLQTQYRLYMAPVLVVEEEPEQPRLGYEKLLANFLTYLHLLNLRLEHMQTVADMSGQTYWRAPFTQLCSPKQLTEYMVMQVDIVSEKDKPHKIPSSTKHVLADLWVARMSDLGVNDQQYFCRTHLGHLLNAGDTVLGFDVANANLNHAEFEKVKLDKLPDVVIVKKIFGDKALRNRRRRWKLKHLNDELYAKDTDSEQKDYNDFLEDLEEDATFRQNVNIYLDKNKIPVDTDDLDDSGAPQISLQEMLEDLDISTDATGEEGAAMME